MMERMPFGNEPDPELGSLIRDVYRGPDPVPFLARMNGVLGGLPPRASQWDVLATWARPSVVAVAAAAAFFLGVTLWQSWRRQTAGPGAVPPSVSVAMLYGAPNRPAEDPILYAVLEGR